MNLSFLFTILFIFCGQAFAAPVLLNPIAVKQITVNYKNKNEKIYCYGKIPGNIQKRSKKILFTSYKDALKKLTSKKDQKVATKIKDLQKLGKTACVAQLTPTPFPTPTFTQTIIPDQSTPAPTPTLTPTSLPASDNFDLQGNTTEQGRVLFDIPLGLKGNIALGRIIQDRFCTGCHVERINYTFNEIRQKIKQAPMFYEEQDVPNQELANLVAYLNRFRP